MGAGPKLAILIYNDNLPVATTLTTPMRAKTALRTHLQMTMRFHPPSRKHGRDVSCDSEEPTLDQLTRIQLAKRSEYLKRKEEEALELA
jgi:hypothetical protein